MKILLIVPIDREFMPPSVFPLGAGYVTAALEEAGHEVHTLDFNVNRANVQESLTSTLEGDQFDWVGISSIITQYKTVKHLSSIVKKLAPNTPLVHGGAGPTSHPDIFIENVHADIVILGEGEQTSVELCEALSKGSLFNCPGLAFLSGTRIVRTPPREAIEDLDDVPFPAWNRFPVEEYIKNNLYKPADRARGINVMTSRGCPARCTYCMRNFGRNVRFRSVENIFNEVSLFNETYGIDHVHFLDDTLATDKQRLLSLCEILAEQEWDITWSANARVTQVDPELLGKMEESGCRYISYGIESASPLILKEMQKGITPERSADAIRWTREAGITPHGYFMIGFPSETEETIRASVDFCKKNLVGGEFFFVTPFPGTPVWEDAKARNLISNDDVYLEIAGEVRNFVVNITKTLDNDTLFNLKEKAERDIRYHLKANGIQLKESTRENPWEAAKSLPVF